MDDLTARVEELETLVLALGVQTFGDTPGHDFHGNQYTEETGDAGGIGRSGPQARTDSPIPHHDFTHQSANYGINEAKPFSPTAEEKANAAALKAGTGSLTWKSGNSLYAKGHVAEVGGFDPAKGSPGVPWSVGKVSGSDPATFHAGRAASSEEARGAAADAMREQLYGTKQPPLSYDAVRMAQSGEA